MPISCHFRDCKALLVASLTHVRCAIASTRPLPLGLGAKNSCAFSCCLPVKNLRPYNCYCTTEKYWSSMFAFRVLLEQNCFYAAVLFFSFFLLSCHYNDNALADYRPADYRRQIINRLSADYRLFISGRIFVQ